LADPAGEDNIPVPMTQEEIGDATGLTAVHVNRTMRALVEQGLIARSAGAIRILDAARLSRVANHVPRSERLDPVWLPSIKS
jgi:CRP/FNR family transcriptional regulator